LAIVLYSSHHILMLTEGTLNVNRQVPHLPLASAA
jgi:hypothetical protein